jgi:hypothetical protein
MARATEPQFPRNPLNGQIRVSKQQVTRSRHTPFQDIPVGWHAQTLAKRTLEVAHANACKTGEFVQRD